MSNSNLELKDLTKYRLDEIDKIKDYFNAEIKERKDIVKKLSKYIVAFDYADKLVITLSASFGTLSIEPHATVVGIPVGIAGASLTVIFTVTTGVVKTLLNITRKKKKKHNKIIALPRRKLNIIETLISGDTNYIYKNELDKACFAHDAAYSDSKYLIKRTVADKILKNKAFDIAKDPKYDGYQRGLVSMVSNFFDKKSKGSGAKHVNTKLIPQNEQLADELHKPIIRKFKKRKVYSAFKDNIWAADLADMQLLSRYNKGIRFLLCVIDIFSKYAWVVPLKDKKGISIVKAFQIILKQSNRKPNKIWVDKGSEFYNASFKKWLQDNDAVMYSTHNEGKSVVAERFFRTLKGKIYKYMTSISKNVYIEKLNDIVDEYNNTYHITIKMKPIDVKDNTYINTNKENNDTDPKFKVGDRVRISKCKNILAKGYTPNWSEEVFVIKKVKNTVPWTYVINDLNGEEITGTFYERELQKTSQEEFRIEKVIKRKGNKIYVKWKGYDNSFNSWIDKASLVQRK